MQQEGVGQGQWATGVGKNVCLNKSNSCLSARFKTRLASLERERDRYHLDYIYKLLQCYYPEIRHPPYQINKRPLCTRLAQLPEVSEGLHELYA